MRYPEEVKLIRKIHFLFELFSWFYKNTSGSSHLSSLYWPWIVFALPCFWFLYFCGKQSSSKSPAVTQSCTSGIYKPYQQVHIGLKNTMCFKLKLESNSKFFSQPNFLKNFHHLEGGTAAPRWAWVPRCVPPQQILS